MNRFAATSIVAVTAALTQAASASVVYNSLPAPSATPIGVPSLAYAANSIGEAGDGVTLSGTDRLLQSVTVGMSDFATFADNPTFAGNVGPLGFNMPLTVSVYAPAVYTYPNGDTLPTTSDDALATKTINAFIPYKPAGYTALTGFNGYYFTLDVDMSDLGVTLPDSVVTTVAYNSQNSGVNPTGVAGPYNSLNFGLTQSGPSVGTDSTPGLYLGYDNNGDYPYNFGTYVGYTTTMSISAVPEPTALAIFGIGAGLLLRRHRRASRA